MSEQQINPRHAETRKVLRVVGPVVAGVGLIFTVIGVGSFFAAFGGGGMPRYFWCAFVGLPLLAVGLMITKVAYLGAVTRYLAGEVAPVGKDVVNYLGRETRPGVRDFASAVAEGLAGERPADTCPKCGTANDEGSRFCKSCGESLPDAVACPACGRTNDPDAKFCNHCGQAVA